jgi:DNA-binding MarR family transcriptional regulator
MDALRSAPVSRLDDLRRVEQAIARIGRISNGRDAARYRSERSGVMLSRPSITIISTLRQSGPVRLSLLARLTDLEAPLISREIRELVEAGLVRRSADPTDGRAGIVELTPAGRQAYQAYRSATDDIISETFAGWSANDLHDLRIKLERVVQDFTRLPARGTRAS